jgi:two-component system, cell cycle sensor histidine kinase and response regulator CckA
MPAGSRFAGFIRLPPNRRCPPDPLRHCRNPHSVTKAPMLSIQVSSPLSLLLVEDDAASREVTAISLGMAFPFLTLHLASSGQEGVELYHKHHPDIVLTDINMPGMDGIRMAQQILAETPQAQIIVISAHTELPYLLNCIQLGIRHYVLKPLEHQPLFKAVADCVKRVQLERQVREQEQYIRLLSQVVEQNSSLIALAGKDGRILYANGKFMEFMGYGAEEITGLDLRRLHFQEAPEEEFEGIWNRIRSGEEWRGEGVNRKKNGELFHEAVSIAPILDGEGEISHFVTIREDISSKKRSQQEMDRAQKLESLGTLAGGIAHDFNNILTGVLGNVSFALASISDVHRLRRHLQEAEKATLRAADLTRELLTFSRGGLPVKKKVSLRRLVEESASIVLRGGNVVREISIPESVDAVEVDEGQMRQAFNNILMNAVQAMPGGGRVTISARNVTLGGDNELGLEQGSFLRIAFADQGYGVAENIRGRIFDPYFTTKGGCSGLGLASAHSIIANHRGHIAVDSSPGSGATFICHLPSSGTPLAEAEEVIRPTLPQRAPQLGAAVLIMDDEASIRNVAEKMLRCLGYQPTTCSNGVDAIALYSRGTSAGKPYLAVIMDLTVVGGMGGKEAAQHILAIDPAARLVVSSGYSDDPVLADHRRYGFCAVLPKPYKVADLAEVMSQVGGAVAPAPREEPRELSHACSTPRD